MSTRITLLGVVAAALVAGCFPQGMRLPQSPMLGAFERKAGRIAYIGTDGNVYTVDQTGASLAQITADADLRNSQAAVLYRTPTWSRESDTLAVLRHDLSGGSLTHSALLLVAALGGQPSTLFQSDDEYPIYFSWSPVGDRIALLTSRDTASQLVVRSVPVAGGEPQVVDVGRPLYWAWTPGGEALLAHIGGAEEQNPGQARVTLLELGQTVAEHGLGLDPFLFQAPSISSQGDMAIVAAHDEAGEPALLVTSLAGDTLSEVAPLQQSVAFAWSPDGRHAAYITSDSAQPAILGRMRLLDLSDPQHPVQIESGEDLVVAFDWSPDGRQILSYAPALAAPAEGDSTDPAFLLRMMVTDVETGRSHRLATFRPTDEFLDILPFFDQYQQSATAWSPDSRNVVFTAMTDSGQPAVFVAAASGTVEARGIAEGTYAVWSWK